eukprot:jgi/Mesvir1/6514/Mv16781-RA.1
MDGREGPPSQAAEPHSPPSDALPTPADGSKSGEHFWRRPVGPDSDSIGDASLPSVSSSRPATHNVLDGLRASLEGRSDRQAGRRQGVDGYAGIRPVAAFVLACTASFLLTSLLLLAAWPRLRKTLCEGFILAYYVKLPLVTSCSFFFVNLLNMVSERDASRMSLNIVVCFINGAGVFTYLLMSNQALMVVMTGISQQWVLPQRYLYWCHATAAALYVLCQMSSISYRRRTCLLLANTSMLLLRLVSSMVGRPWLSMALFLISCALTAYTMHQIWFIINEAIAGMGRESALVLNLTVFRLFLLVIWAGMPIVWLAGHLRLVDDVRAEFLYIVEDVFMQGLFSSPLLYVSFLSMDQRRMNIRVLLEETRGNELVVSLKGAMAQKEEFLATMSYEMKTPLQGIIQLAEQAAVMSSDDDIIAKANEIRANGSQLQKLVNGILSRVLKQEHSLYMERKRVDLSAVVDEVITVIKPVAVRGVKLRNEIPSTTPHIFVDYNRLVQILINVLGSYVKFTSAGIIAVTADANKEPGLVAVSVTDSGPGPAYGYSQGQDVLASFVTPGRWAWQGMRKSGPTLHDLGLRLTREMVRAMDGKLSVSSSKEPHGETRVTFTLPVYDGAAASKVTASASLLSNTLLDGSGNSPWSTRVGHMGAVGLVPSASLSPSKGANGGEGSRSASNTDAGDSSKPEMPADGTAGVAEFDDGELSTDGVHNVLPGGSTSGLAGLGRSTSCPTDGSDAVSRSSLDSYRTRLDDDVIEDPLALLKSDGGASQKPTHKEKYGVVEILSVDDDPVNQMVIESMLLKMGFKVQQALDGPEALDFLTECSALPDLILLDVMMPRMSGYEVCAAVRKMFPHNAIPVIMVSAKSQEEDIVMGLKAGSNDYITKPFKRSEIMARINTQLRLQDMRKLEVNAARAHKLLHEMLPRSIIQRLQSGQRMIADSHADVTILFSDIVSFTTLASSQPTMKIIVMLNEMFSHFDDLVDHHKVFKVETVGDAYMVVGGHDGIPRHVDRMLEMARGMIASVESLKLPPGMGPVQIRVGMHTGPAYAGVIGKKCPRFCFFGDTVNTAARMESNGFPMGIHVSRATFMRARRREWLEVADREIKEKGRMLTYLLREGIYANMEAVELEKLLAGKSSVGASAANNPRLSTNSGDATSIQLLLPNSPRGGPSRAPRLDPPRYDPSPAPESDAGSLSAAINSRGDGSATSSSTPSKDKPRSAGSRDVDGGVQNTAPTPGVDTSSETRTSNRSDGETSGKAHGGSSGTSGVGDDTDVGQHKRRDTSEASDAGQDGRGDNAVASVSAEGGSGSNMSAHTPGGGHEDPSAAHGSLDSSLGASSASLGASNSSLGSSPSFSASLLSSVAGAGLDNNNNSNNNNNCNGAQPPPQRPFSPDSSSDPSLSASLASSTGAPLMSDKSVDTGPDLDPAEQLEAILPCLPPSHHGGGMPAGQNANVATAVPGHGGYDSLGLDMGMHAPGQGSWGGQPGWAGTSSLHPSRRSTGSSSGLESISMEAAYEVEGGGGHAQGVAPAHWGTGFQAADIPLMPDTALRCEACSTGGARWLLRAGIQPFASVNTSTLCKGECVTRVTPRDLGGVPMRA